MVARPDGSIPEIALDNVGKRFRDGAVALEDISLSVERGEFVSLLGPSGCGKSTLLKIVSGLSAASGGNVRVNDIWAIQGHATVECRAPGLEIVADLRFSGCT